MSVMCQEVCLFGFSHRMLVYEYVDNGILDQWLHEDGGEVSELTWEIKMNIILGTAKGYEINNFILFFFSEISCLFFEL